MPTMYGQQHPFLTAEKLFLKQLRWKISCPGGTWTHNLLIYTLSILTAEICS